MSQVDLTPKPLEFVRAEKIQPSFHKADNSNLKDKLKQFFLKRSDVFSKQIEIISNDINNMGRFVIFTQDYLIKRYNMYRFEIIFIHDNDDIKKAKKDEYGESDTKRVAFIFNNKGYIETISFHNFPRNGFWNAGLISWNEYEGLDKIVFDRCKFDEAEDFFPQENELSIILIPILLLAYIIGLYKPKETIYNRVKEIILKESDITNSLNIQLNKFKKAKIINYNSQLVEGYVKMK